MVSVLSGRDEAPQQQEPKIRVAVFGAGRVGATVTAAWLRAGAHVTLADVDTQRVQKINGHQTVFDDEPLIDETLWEGLRRGNCRVTSETSGAASKANFVIVTVPVGLKDGRADIDHVLAASRDIGAGMVPGALVVLETSVPPGTTEGPMRDELEGSSGMKAGGDFLLAYSPERIFEGRALRDLEENYLKIVAGLDQRSLDAAASAYSMIAKRGVLKMSGLRAAEAEKLLEGIYRDVNIALANELANYCEAAGLDYWELSTAANSQPYCNLHRPGPGVGGACIPVYPQFVMSDAMESGLEVPLTREARTLNQGRPEEVLAKALSVVNLAKGDKVALLGLAFRGDVADDRLSPSYSLLDGLRKKGFEVAVHDSFVMPPPDRDVTVSTSIDEAVKGAKLIVLATDHSEYKRLTTSKLVQMSGSDPAIYDSRGILDRKQADTRLHTIGVGSRKDPGR